MLMQAWYIHSVCTGACLEGPGISQQGHVASPVEHGLCVCEGRWGRPLTALVRERCTPQVHPHVPSHSPHKGRCPGLQLPPALGQHLQDVSLALLWLIEGHGTDTRRVSTVLDRGSQGVDADLLNTRHAPHPLRPDPHLFPWAGQHCYSRSRCNEC
jgi:hypothetical protein